MIYLASPYSHPDPAVRQRRFELACAAAAHRMESGLIVYSPIAHSHPIEQFMDQQQSHEFWMRQCVAMLKRAESLVVLTLPGWEASKGVGLEINIARALNMDVTYEPE